MTCIARRRLAVVLAWTLGSIGAVFVLGVGYFGATAWRRLPELAATAPSARCDRILSADGYGLLMDTHARPYVFRAPIGRGEALVFGAEHVKDPAHGQCAEIVRAWDEFRPTVALVESRLGTMFPQLMDPVRTFGEPGLVHGLARRDGIRTYTWEPPTKTLIQSVLGQGFSKEQVALRMHLGPYFSNLRHGRPESPESFVRDTLAERNRWPGIEGVLGSVADIDAAWARAFPAGPDWRDVSDQFGLPGFLGAMDLNLARDRHLVSIVEELAAQGERVFVIAGSSHAVKVHPALAPAPSPD